MRNTGKTTLIRVTLETKKKLETDKNNFQKTIGGGIWSIDDTIKEYIKIITSRNQKWKHP